MNEQPISPELMKKRRKERWIRLTILAVFLLSVFFLSDQKPLADCVVPRYQGTFQYTEESWVFRHGDEILEPELTLPAFRHLKKGEIYSISTRLTYDGSQDRDPYCFYFVDHMFCRATLDGEELFSYMPEDIRKPDRSKSPGNVYSSLPLPEDCQGRELTIEFVPSLDADIEYQLPNPSFADHATYMVQTFRGELVHNVILVICAFIGVCMVVFSTFAMPRDKYREGLFIGTFATLFSFYNLTESDFDFYMISNPYYTYVLDYTCFTLIPLFLMAFVGERLSTRLRPVIRVLMGIGAGLFMVETILHYSGIWDMREILTVIHVTYAAEFLVVFLLFVVTKNNGPKLKLLLQMAPVLLGIFLDGSVYYLHWQLNTADSTFTAMGVLILLLVELYHVWRYSVELYVESVRSQDYRQMAYVDALTGIGNRRAYNAERTAIQEEKRQAESLICASADLNYLKKTNDTLGHAAGDFLIRSAAGVLADLSEDYGHVYRVGGDEFAVILYNMSIEEFENRLEKMHSQVRAINSRSETKLSIALGYEWCRPRDLETATESADRKMYENKAAIKAENAGLPNPVPPAVTQK